MKVQSEFQIKHFIEYTRTKGGVLEILHSNKHDYTVEYNKDAYEISHQAMKKIRLLNQDLIIKNRIMQ